MQTDLLTELPSGHKDEGLPAKVLFLFGDSQNLV